MAAGGDELVPDLFESAFDVVAVRSSDKHEVVAAGVVGDLDLVAVPYDCAPRGRMGAQPGPRSYWTVKLGQPTGKLGSS